MNPRGFSLSLAAKLTIFPNQLLNQDTPTIMIYS